MTTEEATTQGIEIVNKVAHIFFRSNKVAYTKLVFEVEDLEGYLYETVLFKKYIPYVEKSPFFYDTSSFGKSLFVACRKAMLSHIKKYILSQKRGDILAPGVVVELDKTIAFRNGGDNAIVYPEVAKNASSALLRDMKGAIDSCDCPLAQRVLVLLSREIYTSKTQIKKRLGLTPSRFNQVWLKVQKAFEHLKTTELPDTLYEPAT